MTCSAGIGCHATIHMARREILPQGKVAVGWRNYGSYMWVQVSQQAYLGTIRVEDSPDIRFKSCANQPRTALIIEPGGMPCARRLCFAAVSISQKHQNLPSIDRLTSWACVCNSSLVLTRRLWTYDVYEINRDCLGNTGDIESSPFISV